MQHTRSNEKPWTAHYPAGLAAELEPLPYANLGAIATAAAERYGARTAATMVLPNGMEASLSFAAVDRLAEAFAAWLTQVAGVKPGDRLALLLPNVLAYPVCAFGALKAGAVVVNTNPLYTPRELEAQLKDSGATALVVVDLLADKLDRVLPQTDVRAVVTASLGDFFPAVKGLLIRTKLRLSGRTKPVRVPHTKLTRVVAEGGRRLEARRRSDASAPVSPGPDDLALLQYTGGTTGVAKGAMLTHGNLLANVGQIDQITRGYLQHGRETVLTVLPLYHVFAFTINLLFGFHSGSHGVLAPDPRPVHKLRPVFERHEITWATAVDTLLRALLAEPWFKARPPRTLRAVYAGGTATRRDVREGWEAATGGIVIEGYGLSETSPLVTFNPAAREGERLVRTLPQVGGVGLPLPGTDLRVVDEAGVDVAPGEDGELLVRGPQVMRGYWRQAVETAQVLEGGWLRTGDVGRQDADGYLEITDRKKDLIIVSGFNVYPNEVEACIAEHPDVAEVAVVGVPDESSGEAVVAFVVPRQPGAASAEAIREHCRGMLVGYKVPRRVRFLDELPKNALGKNLRRELRPLAAEGVEAAPAV